MNAEVKRGPGRPVGTVLAGSINDRLMPLEVGESVVWLTDDPAQPLRWQRHLASKRCIQGRKFRTESGVLVLAGQKVEYALKIRRYV